jgi:hypothetical protein
MAQLCKRKALRIELKIFKKFTIIIQNEM